MSLSDASVAWRPDESTAARARLSEFIAFCGLSSFDEMYRRSVDDVPRFTDQLLRFLKVPFDPPYTDVLDLSRGPAWPRWCIGGGLNITDCLDAHVKARGEQPALIWEGEEGTTRTLTYAELGSEVRRCAAGLRSLGLRKGDPVGIHLPMIPETAIALLAIGRIGGIAVPLFSGYGPQAIETRLNDVGAKALFACDGFFRRGTVVPALAAVDEALTRCPSVQHTILIGRAGGDSSGRLSWHALLERGGDDGAERTSAEDPLLILYTSGTTGRPKGILHTHCGFPVKAAQDMAFGVDVGMGDRILWVTDIGWMMGPWLIYGALVLGATAVLYDGAPDFPVPADSGQSLRDIVSRRSASHPHWSGE